MDYEIEIKNLIAYMKEQRGILEGMRDEIAEAVRKRDSITDIESAFYEDLKKEYERLVEQRKEHLDKVKKEITKKKDEILKYNNIRSTTIDQENRRLAILKSDLEKARKNAEKARKDLEQIVAMRNLLEGKQRDENGKVMYLGQKFDMEELAGSERLATRRLEEAEMSIPNLSNDIRLKEEKLARLVPEGITPLNHYLKLQEQRKMISDLHFGNLDQMEAKIEETEKKPEEKKPEEKKPEEKKPEEKKPEEKKPEEKKPEEKKPEEKKPEEKKPEEKKPEEEKQPLSMIHIVLSVEDEGMAMNIRRKGTSSVEYGDVRSFYDKIEKKVSVTKEEREEIDKWAIEAQVHGCDMLSKSIEDEIYTGRLTVQEGLKQLKMCAGLFAGIKRSDDKENIINASYDLTGLGKSEMDPDSRRRLKKEAKKAIDKGIVEDKDVKRSWLVSAEWKLKDLITGKLFNKKKQEALPKPVDRKRIGAGKEAEEMDLQKIGKTVDSPIPWRTGITDKFGYRTVMTKQEQEAEEKAKKAVKEALGKLNDTGREGK